MNFILQKLLFYGGQALIDLIKAWLKKVIREKKQAPKLEELKKVDADKAAPPEKTAEAYENYINSGR